MTIADGCWTGTQWHEDATQRDGPAALIQKALAKIYGCYEHLNNGRVGAALVDLTGGASDKVYLREVLGDEFPTTNTTGRSLSTPR